MRPALLAAIVATGIALRLGAFLQNPPLGLDETRLALNIAGRSYGELLKPLAHDQSAPPLYLWAQHTIVSVLGVQDWALRLLPLAFGVGLVALTPSTLGRLLGGPATIVVTALAAFSPLLVHYSTSVKQYGPEAALTLVVLGLGLRCREASYDGPPAARLTALGTLLPWVATPAGFVLAGVTGCALADLAQGTARARSFLLRSVPFWAISVAAAYLVAYEPASRNPYLRRYWSSALLGPAGDGVTERLWALSNENLWGLALGYPGPPGRHLSNLAFLVVALAILALQAIGCRWLLTRFGWGLLVLTVGPPLAAIAASVVGVYPVSLRLMLFAAPLAQLLFVAGLAGATTHLPDASSRRAWALAGAALAVPLLAISLLQVGRTAAPEDVRTLVAELSQQRRGEPVYVFAGSIPPWAYYSTDWGAPDRRRLEFVAGIAGAGGPAFENAPSRGHVGPREGAGLEYRAAAGLELYGLPTGIEWTPSLGPLKRSPDAGWAQREADRVRSMEGPSVWVLMSHLVGTERELHRELERRGACATYVRELDNASLVRYALGPVQGRRDCSKGAA